MCEAEFLRACELVVASGGKIPETSAKVATSVMSVVPTKPAETPAQHTPYQYTDPLTSSESEQEDEVELETDEEIVAGASAGGIGQLLASPADLVKVRLQTGGSKYNGFVDCLRQV